MPLSYPRRGHRACFPWTLVRLLSKAFCPLVVKLSCLDAAAIHANHPAKPNAKSLEPQAHPIATVIKAIVVAVTVDFHAEVTH